MKMGDRIGRRQAMVALAGGALMPALVRAMPAAAAAVENSAADPEDVGVDSGPLIRLSEWIRREKLDVRALLVVKNGSVVFERYCYGVTREHNHSVYSVTKSVTSLLAGMLIDDGRIAGAHAPIADILSVGPQSARLMPLLADKRGIEVGHVLSMASGLRYAHDPENSPIYGAADRLRMALEAHAEATPGTRYLYSDGDATIAGALVAAASGKSIDAFARERLFGPLDMHNAVWPGVDSAGLHPGGWALRLRAIDMAKIGQLVLDGGVGNERRLVSKAWIDAATSAKVAPNYGYLWWVGGLGAGECWARGYKGQRIAVLPRHRAVVVLASILPRGQEVQTVETMFRQFIMPALEPGRRLYARPEIRTAIATELRRAQRSSGDPRNMIEAQDTPRR